MVVTSEALKTDGTGIAYSEREREFTFANKTESVCLCVCVSVCFFVSYARPQIWADLHDIKQIWHVASLYPSDGHRWVSERRSNPRARAPCALHTPLQKSGKLRLEIRNSGLKVQWIERENRAPYARGVTERRMRNSGPLVINKFMDEVTFWARLCSDAVDSKMLQYVTYLSLWSKITIWILIFKKLKKWSLVVLY